MSRPRVRSALLLSLAVPTIATGAWALLAPHGWHDDFPGFGRDWLPVFGSYNEHLVRDFGSALLALGVLLACAVAAPRTPLWRAAPAAFLVFAVPHLAYHVAHVGELPAGDDAANLVLLTLSVVIPTALLRPGAARAFPHRARAARAETGRLAPARPRGLLRRIAYRVSSRRYGHVLGPVGATAHNPTLLAGYAAFELALERADRVDRRLEELAAMRAATMTGCPFCLDFGFDVLDKLGVTRQQMQDIATWRDSAAFTPDERLVLEYAEAMSGTPPHVSDELFDRLRARFDEGAIVELTAAVAFENYRGRFNQAVGLGSEGFCQVPLPGLNGRPAEGALA